MKETRIYQNMRYLIKVAMIEKEIQKMWLAGGNQIQEDVENTFQIKIINLSSKQQNDIVWSLDITQWQALLSEEFTSKPQDST